MLRDETHPWESARKHFDTQTMPKLKAIGKTVGVAADAGDEKAKAVISLYAMLHRSFDPLTTMRLDEAITNYETN